MFLLSKMETHLDHVFIKLSQLFLSRSPKGRYQWLQQLRLFTGFGSRLSSNGLLHWKCGGFRDLRLKEMLLPLMLAGGAGGEW